MPNRSPIPAGTRIGHVHLKVSDLKRALDFYCGVLGFELQHGASDHGVSEALYLHDPDHNGIELYWDKPESQWPRNPDGSLAMVTQRLDLQDLINTQH